MLKNIKLNFGILFAFFLFIPGLLHGANALKIDLDLNNVTLKEFFSAIEKQSDYTFMFNNVDLNQTVSIQAKQTNLDDILRSVLTPKGITYEIVSKRIILNASAGNNATRAKSEPPSKIVITGVVTDEKGEPVIGANIIERGTTNGTVTNIDGKFTLEVGNNATIRVSYIGYLEQDISTIGRTNFNITLVENAKALEEVVVVGYGTQKKASLTAAISTISAQEISTIPTSNLSNTLQGRLSGTYVQTTSGVPGLASDIRVRINTSWNTAPLVYVIDGVVRDKTSFDALDPNEIESFTVLKDAASAAIYGSRSSNGVIMVTTKMGRGGKPVITFSTVMSKEKFTQLPQYLSATQSADIWNEVYQNISSEEKDWLVKNNPDGLAFFNSLYKSPANQHYALSVSGGSDKVTYYIGGSYFNQTGFVPNLDYNKYNIRSNIQAKLTDRLTLGLNLSTSNGRFNSFNYEYTTANGGDQEMYRFLLYFDPFITSPYINGKPLDTGWIGNPAVFINDQGYRKNSDHHVDGLISLEYKIPGIEGLTGRVSYSNNYNNNFTKQFAKQATLYQFGKTGANSRIYTDEMIGSRKSSLPSPEFIANDNFNSNSYQLNTQLSYENTFGKHNISAVAVYEQYDYSSKSSLAYRSVFSLFPIDQFFGTSNDPKNWKASGSEVEDGRLSYIGRVNYAYDDKYLFSASVRRDGSIKFAPNKRWGNFPSVSAGWVISQENFFNNSKALDFIDFLKIRGSFAQTGNDAIGGWQWLEQYNISSSSYYMGAGGYTSPRLTYGGIPNPNLTWEKSNTLDVGLDLQMLNNALTFTTDFWKRHTYDILGSRILAIPYEYGASLPAENYGIVDATGAEFELGYKNRVGSDFSYSVKFNFGLSGTKVIKKDVASNAQPVDNPNGKSLSYQAGYLNNGIIKTEDQLNKLPTGYTIFGAKPELGMMDFKDISGPDSKPDGRIDSYDRVVLGNHFGPGAAQQSFGMQLNLEWKNFSLETLFAGLSGFKIAYSDPWGKEVSGGNLVVKYHDNEWSPSNPNGTHPKYYSWGDSRAQGYVQVSDYNVYNASFIRMKYLNLGYSLPSKLLQHAKVSSVRLFVQGTNLFLLSQFKFYDPELYGFGAYPFSKNYSVGIDIKF